VAISAFVIAVCAAGGCAKAFGWRWGMWAPGLIGIAVGLAVLGTVRDRPQDCGYPAVDDGSKVASKAQQPATPSVPPSMKGSPASATPTAAKASNGSMLGAMRSVLRMPAIWALAFTYFFIYVVRQGVTSWLVFYLMAEKGATDAAQAALTVSGLELGGLAGSMVAGALSDKSIRAAAPGVGHVGKRVQVIMGYTVAMAAMLAALKAVPASNVPLQWAAIAGLGFSIYGPQMLIGLTGAELVAPSAVGASQGILGWIAYLGAANAGIPLSYVVQSAGWGGFFTALLGACAMALVLLSTVCRAQSYNQRTALATQLV
jgi:OPA family sugar phosphate sensor protein UhpC-like MFS transporter